MNPFKHGTNTSGLREKSHAPDMHEHVVIRRGVVLDAVSTVRESRTNSAEPAFVAQVTRSQVELDTPQSSAVMTALQPEITGVTYNATEAARQAVEDAWKA